MKKFTLSLSFFLSVFALMAQHNDEPWRLGHWLSAEEMLRKGEIGRGFVETPPPAAPIRNIAEFDKMQGALVRYPFGIPVELIREMSENIMVTTIVLNANQQNTVTQQYQAAGVNMSNTNFLLAPSDSYWTRDYGPWFVSDSSNNIGIVDFPYNRPRPNDDDIPKKVAGMLGIPWYGMNLIHTGGNYMTEGYHNSSSTTLVWVENPTLTAAQVDEKVHDYLGIENYMVEPDPNGTYIDHIDCWGKFLAPDKVLIRKVPVSHSQYALIEATAAFYASQPCAYGYNYKVFRVNTPDDQPYTNSIILNNKVLVPIMNSVWDDSALAAYSAAMPGYEVIGFIGNPSTPWESTDALHCRVMGIADIGQLFISHIPLSGNQPAQDNFHIQADLIRCSDSAAYADSVLIWYKTGNDPYKMIHMTNISGDHYSGYIPKQPAGTVIKYYLYAADKSGRHATAPFIGIDDPYTFTSVYTDLTAVPDTLFFETYDDCYDGKTSMLTNYTSSAINLTSLEQNGNIPQDGGLWFVDPYPATFPLAVNPGSPYGVTVRFAIMTDNRVNGYFIDTLNYETVNGSHKIILMVNDTLDLWSDINNLTGKNNLHLRNYPNPFSQTTRIVFDLETSSYVHLFVMNSLGNEVEILKEGMLEKGQHTCFFNAENLPGGVYLLKLVTGSGTETKKMLLVR